VLPATISEQALDAKLWDRRTAGIKRARELL
jgi:hypothetical protein